MWYFQSSEKSSGYKYYCNAEKMPKKCEMFLESIFKGWMTQEHVLQAHLRSFQIKRLSVVTHLHDILFQVCNAPVFVITHSLLHKQNQDQFKGISLRELKTETKVIHKFPALSISIQTPTEHLK